MRRSTLALCSFLTFDAVTPAGPRYFAEKAQGGPEWGLRATVTLIFPR